MRAEKGSTANEGVRADKGSTASEGVRAENGSTANVGVRAEKGSTASERGCEGREGQYSQRARRESQTKMIVHIIMWHDYLHARL